MRLLLVATIAAAPLGAQTPQDTAATRAAARAFANAETTGRVRFVADTAWVAVIDSTADVRTTAGNTITVGSVARLKAVRVERRGEVWKGVTYAKVEDVIPSGRANPRLRD